MAAATVRAHLDRLAARGVTATGLVLHSVGDHASAGVELARYATEARARTIALGSSPRGRAAQLADGSITSAVVRNAGVPVVLVVPGQEPHELSAAALTQLRHA